MDKWTRIEEMTGSGYLRAGLANATVPKRTLAATMLSSNMILNSLEMNECNKFLLYQTRQRRRRTSGTAETIKRKHEKTTKAGQSMTEGLSSDWPAGFLSLVLMLVPPPPTKMITSKVTLLRMQMRTRDSLSHQREFEPGYLSILLAVSLPLTPVDRDWSVLQSTELRLQHRAPTQRPQQADNHVGAKGDQPFRSGTESSKVLAKTLHIWSGGRITYSVL
jgi:hypothetical protein